MTLEPGDTATLTPANGPHPLTEASPTLDAIEDAWVGVFPGLGSISVGIAGDVVISADGGSGEDPLILTQRERALRWGWADPLSWLRRGYHLIDGIALGHPNDDCCIVVSGDYHDSSRLVVKLISEGWLLIADRPSPHTWVGDDLVAAPREAPFLMSRGRAIKADLEHQSVRADSDTVEVQVPRLEQERRVAAFIGVGTRRPFESNLEQLTGHKAFRYAAGLMMSLPRLLTLQDVDDASTQAEEQTQELKQVLKLTKIPMLRLRRTPGNPETEIDDLMEWWNGQDS